MKTVERKIEDEANRMATHTNERRERARAKLEDAKEAMEKAEEKLRSLEVQVQEKSEAASNARREESEFQAARDHAKSRMVECDNQIKVIRDSEKNALAPYGLGMESIIREVQNARWHGQQPIGPLGRFVKLKDSRWADVLRVNLSGAMVSWAVTDARDRMPLKNLLERHGKYVVQCLPPIAELTCSISSRNVPIIISAVDLFDYSRGEPPEDYLTPLRVLEVRPHEVMIDFQTHCPVPSSHMNGRSVFLSTSVRSRASFWLAIVLRVTMYVTGLVGNALLGAARTKETSTWSPVTRMFPHACDFLASDFRISATEENNPSQ